MFVLVLGVRMSDKNIFIIYGAAKKNVIKKHFLEILVFVSKIHNSIHMTVSLRHLYADIELKSRTSESRFIEKNSVMRERLGNNDYRNLSTPMSFGQ